MRSDGAGLEEGELGAARGNDLDADDLGQQEERGDGGKIGLLYFRTSRVKSPWRLIEHPYIQSVYLQHVHTYNDGLGIMP